jgi:hypothetical protein
MHSTDTTSAARPPLRFDREHVYYHDFATLGRWGAP